MLVTIELSVPGDSSRTFKGGLPSLLSSILLGTVGVLSFIVQPGLVQGFVTELGRTEPEAVNLAGIEMLGTAISAVILAFVTARLNWRFVVAAGLLLAAVGNILSAAFVDDDLLYTFRFIAGAGHGAIISISFTLISVTRHTERNLAVYLTSLLSYGALLLWFMPAFFDAFGIANLFYMFAAICLLALPTARLVIRSHHSEEAHNPKSRQLSSFLIILALSSILAYNLAIGITWGILALVGLSAGFTEQGVADALFLSQVVAVGGALSSVFLAGRISAHLAILIGMAGGALSIALLLNLTDYAIFISAVCGFNFLWNFALPFILAKVCEFETKGKMMSYAIALQVIGVGAGPIIAGLLIGDGDYTSSQLLCIALFVASYFLLVKPMVRHRQHLAEPADL